MHTNPILVAAISLSIVICLLLGYFTLIHQAISKSATYPNDQQAQIPLDNPVIIFINNDWVTAIVAPRWLSIHSSPAINFTKLINTTNLTFNHTNPLNSAAPYTITITYLGIPLKQLKFTTVSHQSSPQLNDQLNSDLIYNPESVNFPHLQLQKLFPLNTSTYLAIYDLPNNQVILAEKTPLNSSEKSVILNKIKDMAQQQDPSNLKITYSWR